MKKLRHFVDSWFAGKRLKQIFLIISVVLFSAFILSVYMNSGEGRGIKSTLRPIPFRVVTDNGLYTVFNAVDAMSALAPVNKLDTSLDENPYWIFLDLPKNFTPQNESILLNTRHLSYASCWSRQGHSFMPVGRIAGDSIHGFRYEASSWVVAGLQATEQNALLCKVGFIGPATLSVSKAANVEITSYFSKYELNRGFLEGSLILMIGLVFVAAFFNRSFLFACYGFWLIGSLRVAALSVGWDHDFFGYEIPLSKIPQTRMVAIAIYYTSAIMLAGSLFTNFRSKFWYPIKRFFEFTGVLLIVISLTGPYRAFLMVMWPLAVLVCAGILIVAAQHFYQKRSGVSAYYLAAMCVTSCGVFAEVIEAWFGFDFLVKFFNPGSVTLLASAMTAVSLMEFVRETQSQKEQAALKLEHFHERLINIFNIAPAAMFVASRDGELIQYNRHFENEFLNSDGTPIFSFLRKEVLAGYFEHAKDNSDELSREEIRISVGEGQLKWFELIWATERNDVVAVVSDFTSRKDRELALHHQATHDELTGALNRRGLEWVIRLKMEKHVTKIRLGHLDIRRFRHVIRAYGLSFSDKLLKAFYTEFYRYMCAFGDVCRLHMDQFVVLLGDEGDEDAAEAFDRFRSRLRSAPFWIDNRQIMLDVSACLVTFEMRDDVSDIMDALDETVRESKITLKARPHVDFQEFSAVQTRQFLERAKAVGRLGLQELPRHLAMAWQPIMSLDRPTQHLYAESLLRIRDEDGTLKSAGYLIDACVQAGQTALLDSWVLNTTISFLERNYDALAALEAISINVSPNSLNDEFFLEDTIALIQAHRSVASKLCLEVTEVGAVVNLKAVQDFIHRVRVLGVRIALDDFGAGYSNFRYAIDLHADVIKIDGSIIRNIAQSTESLAVARAITALAHDLGCKCVAEWVEDTHTLRVLNEISVDYAQGYVISPAIDPEEFLFKQCALDILESDGQRQGLLGVLNVSAQQDS